MRKTLSMLALGLIVLGLTLIVIGYGADVSEAELLEEIMEEEEPEEPEIPESGDGNGDGNGEGGGGGKDLKRLNIFGYQVSELEFIGFVLIGCGVILLFVKR